MGYLYETHLHTLEGSACARVAGADYIDFMKSRGFAGMIVTDHFFTGNCAVNRSLPWKEKVSLYMAGYRNALAASSGKDFDVMFGIEYNFRGDEYLLYGLDEKWLLDNPDIESLSYEGVYERVHQGGGIMFQAHPYRERGYLADIRLNPSVTDGIEIYNAENDDNMNALAYEYAKKLNVPMTGGSDIHYFRDSALGGTMLPERIDDSADFARLVMAGEGVPTRVLNGEIKSVYDIPTLLKSVHGPSMPVFDKSLH